MKRAIKMSYLRSLVLEKGFICGIACSLLCSNSYAMDTLEDELSKSRCNFEVVQRLAEVPESKRPTKISIEDARAIQKVKDLIFSKLPLKMNSKDKELFNNIASVNAYASKTPFACNAFFIADQVMAWCRQVLQEQVLTQPPQEKGIGEVITSISASNKEQTPFMDSIYPAPSSRDESGFPLEDPPLPPLPGIETWQSHSGPGGGYAEYEEYLPQLPSREESEIFPNEEYIEDRGVALLTPPQNLQQVQRDPAEDPRDSSPILPPRDENLIPIEELSFFSDNEVLPPPLPSRDEEGASLFESSLSNMNNPGDDPRSTEVFADTKECPPPAPPPPPHQKEEYLLSENPPSGLEAALRDKGKKLKPSSSEIGAKQSEDPLTAGLVDHITNLMNKNPIPIMENEMAQRRKSMNPDGDGEDEWSNEPEED